MVVKAVIYTRVSADRAGGRSVAEQETECRAACDRNGWPISEVLSDNDIGASRHSRKHRPAYDKLAAILEPGDVLVTWEASRAQRDLAAYVALRDLCAARSVQWHYGGSTYDLSTGDGRFRTGLDALLAENESEKTRERILRAHRANAAAGKAHGKIPYGYRAVRDENTGKIVSRIPHEAEAPVVRELARRVLSGEGLNTLRKDLDRRGILGPTGTKWNTHSISRILRSPTMAGKRVHRGQTIQGDWEPILSEEDQQALIGILSDPTRKVTRGPEPVHLLTGIAVCGLCSAPMSRMKNTKYPSYVCSQHFHVGRNQTNTDLYVESVMVGGLSDPSLLGSIGVASADAAPYFEEARKLRLRLDGFTSEAIKGNLTHSRLGQIESELLPMIAKAEERARSSMTAPMVAEAVGPDAAEKWEKYTVVRKRDLIRALATVTILPTVGNRRVFDPDRVVVKWHESFQ